MRNQLTLLQLRGCSFVEHKPLQSLVVITHFTQTGFNQMIEHSWKGSGDWEVSRGRGALLKSCRPLNAWPNFLFPVTCSSFPSIAVEHRSSHSDSPLTQSGSFTVVLRGVISLNTPFQKWICSSDLLLGVPKSNTVIWSHLVFWLWNGNIVWHRGEAEQCEREPCGMLVALAGAKCWSLNWTRGTFL